MDHENLLTEDRNGIRWITLNRPTKLNALDRAAIAELAAAVRFAGSDAAVKAVVITGSGEKAFAAGADIAELAALDPRGGQELSRAGQAAFDAVAALPKPVIAAVNGFALGGGCELALACHLRVASAAARFGQPEAKLGLIPGYGGTQRLTRLVGPARAVEMLLTGSMVDASTALAWGLVNRVLEPAELRSAAQRLAEETAAVSPVAAGRCLEAVRLGLDLPLERALELEAALFALCCASEDMREGTRAFLEKRPARFAGR